ncbi:T9SS type A sorting domain-containing protein [Taibaiella chishuiensis]|uniref:Putative secreted protein (Por secretion system target) n=1 Tax=Taibaiella chishuiensis TaxID=1434707 RepID=A0A2P8CZA0_9BACT|nr:T9SS type A sorting domain-containing protein [Taibaiella chishuiensis]PSK90302.1 putative secreted protein (Por secretion system target) [Taibaiella chishuiensis]
MKPNFTKKTAVAVWLSLSAFAGGANAQCLTATYGQYPDGTYFPTCSGTAWSIASDCFAGEYSVVNVTAGVQYTFSSTIIADYLTIANEAGTTTFTSGTSPVVWTATLNGNVRFYTHTNAACGEQNSGRQRRVQCNSTVPVPAACATNTYPQNAHTGVPVNPSPVLTWTPVADASGYRLYSGTTAAGATYQKNVVGSNTAFTGFAPNTTYYWYVVPFNASGEAIGCASTITSFTTGALSNDNCSGAIAINALSGTVSGTTNGATESMPAGACEGELSNQARDVWYSVTADVTGNLAVLTDEFPFQDDMVWEAYSGTCGNLSAAIACSDTLGSLTIAATAGQTYYIRVYRFSSTLPGNFAMQVSGTALPVTMDKLTGKLNPKGMAELNWKTLAEQNNKGFQVQRSEDGITFRTIGFVASGAEGGNSKAALAYGFTDANAVNGTAYYRLLQTDIDGKTEWSNTVRLSAQTKNAFELVAVPNPVKDKVSVRIYGERGSQARILITDLNGKTVRRLQVTADETNVDLGAVPGGIYLLKYTDANRSETLKISKQ